jgi:hypothetical protein
VSDKQPSRAHLIAGGFPPGAHAGHDHDYARLRLLALLSEQNVAASVANDFADVEKWLPVSRLLITYVAGPYPNAAQCSAMREWIEAGGHWLARRFLPDTSTDPQVPCGRARTCSNAWHGHII